MTTIYPPKFRHPAELFTKARSVLLLQFQLGEDEAFMRCMHYCDRALDAMRGWETDPDYAEGDRRELL